MQTSFFPDENVTKSPYRVLARKYRPINFEDMIGQEAMVSTFRNAIKNERIAHAFLLTGIRGVGKTTTARIMARALNCIGSDASLTKPTEHPCGKCIHCEAINNDRHQDVLEIDAASHTGVADIREIIENVKYKPISGRYKIYIIDEVHMLSNSAFNALLKTLEEPPAHIKFILATTEIRKIPATIMSRCQRFDLKRVEAEVLSEHFVNIVAKEEAKIEAKAADLIAGVAAGSVRDGLSILDQAIALSDGDVSYRVVSTMLGMAESESRLQLFSFIAEGDVSKVLAVAKELYYSGVDPVLLLQDLLEVVHAITKIKVLKLDPNQDYSATEAEKYSSLAFKLTISFLNRAWQIISKGVDEVKSSYQPFAACEMVLIRLIYSNTLPSVEELLNSEVSEVRLPVSGGKLQASEVLLSDNRQESYVAMPAREVSVSDVDELNADYIMKLCLEHDEMMLHHHLASDLSIVRVEKGTVFVNLKEWAPKNLLRQLQEFMNANTGRTWAIQQDYESNAPTYHEQAKSQEDAKRQEVASSPLVQEVLNTFTELEISDIKPIKI